jgi:hypothetical protein
MKSYGKAQKLENQFSMLSSSRKFMEIKHAQLLSLCNYRNIYNWLNAFFSFKMTLKPFTLDLMGSIRNPFPLLLPS